MDRTVVGLVVGTVLIFAAILWYGQQGGVVTSPESALVGDAIEIQGQDHIAEGSTDHPPYNSNPPTSGWHWPQPANWGIYETEQPDEQLVHNLEHGGVNVFYKPDISNEEKEKLKAIAGRFRSKVVLAPREKNERKISMTSWGRLLHLDELKEDEIVEFIESNRNHGPEFVP